MGSRDAHSLAHGELAAQGVDPGRWRAGRSRPDVAGAPGRRSGLARGPGNRPTARSTRACPRRPCGAGRAMTRARSSCGGSGHRRGAAGRNVAPWPDRAAGDECRRPGARRRQPADSGSWWAVLTTRRLAAGLLACGLARSGSPGRDGGPAGGVAVRPGAAVKAPALLGSTHPGWTQPGPQAWLAGALRPHHRRGRRLAGGARGEPTVAGKWGWGWLGGLSAGSNVTSLLSASTTSGLVAAWALQQPTPGIGVVVTGVRDVLAASVVTPVCCCGGRRSPGWSAPPRTAGSQMPGGAPVVLWCLPPAAVVLAGR